MASDYLIVGPRYELRTMPAQDVSLSGVSLLNAFRLTRRGQPLGQAVGYFLPNGVKIQVLSEQPLPEEALIEAYRFLARVCAHVTQFRLPLALPSPTGCPELARVLAADGFSPGNPQHWVRPPGPFLLPEEAKLERSHQVYADPFLVPWNLVTREWDVMAKLVADTRADAARARFAPPGPSAPSGPVRVLDLGCGYGKNATALEELGLEAYGIDLSLQAIARCRELVQHPQRFLAGDATALPWADATFDCVMDVGCLHCVPEPQRPAVVGEVARVLKPAGRFYSRSFRPRPPTWLRCQPFKAAAFGLTPEAALALLEPHFTASLWQPHEEMNYLLGRPRK